MRYSIELRDQIYVKDYDFLSFAKIIGKNTNKSMISRYGKNLLDITKMLATDVLKTVAKWAIQKIAKATYDLVGNKIAE